MLVNLSVMRYVQNVIRLNWNMYGHSNLFANWRYGCNLNYILFSDRFAVDGICYFCEIVCGKCFKALLITSQYLFRFVLMPSGNTLNYYIDLECYFNFMSLNHNRFMTMKHIECKWIQHTVSSSAFTSLLVLIQNFAWIIFMVFTNLENKFYEAILHKF